MGCHCSTDFLATTTRYPLSSFSIQDQFKIEKLLGSGTFGQVYECFRRSDGELLAVKIMPRQESLVGQWSHERMFRREVELLMQLDNPYVIRYAGFFEDVDFLYVIVERCSGGELFEHISKARRVSERAAAAFSRQMLQALAYLHAAKVVHRDIKAENFLFKEKSTLCTLKLIDFGMSVMLSRDEELLSELCGSPHYLSPELIHKQYGMKTDIWALGVLIYLMMYGKYPFHGPTTEATVREILKCKVEYKAPNVRLSCEAVDFLKHLLEPDISKRYSAAEALRHVWIDSASSTCAPMNVGKNDQLGLRADDHRGGPRKDFLHPHTANSSPKTTLRRKQDGALLRRSAVSEEHCTCAGLRDAEATVVRKIGNSVHSGVHELKRRHSSKELGWDIAHHWTGNGGRERSTVSEGISYMDLSLPLRVRGSLLANATTEDGTSWTSTAFTGD